MKEERGRMSAEYLKTRHVQKRFPSLSLPLTTSHQILSILIISKSPPPVSTLGSGPQHLSPESLVTLGKQSRWEPPCTLCPA